MELEVTENAAESRFEVSADGELAGFTVYRDRDGVKEFFHTEVFPQFEGHGVGSALARGMLDEMRSRGEKISVTCPFLASWIREHPEYQDA